jgi:hypothetical protein
LAVVERIDCVAETAVLLRLLGGESASALVVGYSELARVVYTYVVERRVVCTAGVDLTSRLLGGKSASALLAGYQLFIRSGAMRVLVDVNLGCSPVVSGTVQLHDLYRKYMKFLVDGFCEALILVEDCCTVEQLESWYTTVSSSVAISSRVKSPLEIAIRGLVGDVCADGMIWSPQVALVLLARYEALVLTPFLSRPVSGQSAASVVVLGSASFNQVVGYAFSSPLGGQSSGSGLSHSLASVLHYPLAVLSHRMHTLFDVFNATWELF